MKRKEKIKQLWKTCFEDTPEFVDLYFDLRYTNDVNLCIESGDEVLAALQLLSYPMTYAGQTVPTAYVSGACTHPDYRGKGVMRELLAEAFSRMHAQGVMLSTLIPATPSLFRYYARSGYADVFRYASTLWKPDACPTDTPSAYNHLRTTEFRDDIYRYLDRKLGERPCCLQHTAADFRVILAALRLEGGQVDVLSRQSRVVAAAVTHPAADGTWTVGELVAESPTEADTLLHAISRASGDVPLRLIHPVQPATAAHPLGMARIIDAPAMLRLYTAAHPEVGLNLALSDELIAANTGYYYLYGGKCMRSKDRLPGGHRHLTVDQLTQELLAPEHPYMSLMLN